MVRSVKYDSPTPVNMAVEAALADACREVLHLQYRRAGEHVARVGEVYVDAIKSGLIPDGCEDAGIIPPGRLATMLARSVRESDHAFVANASSFKKFAAGMDAVVSSVVRARLPEAKPVPEHADANFHLDFAGFVVSRNLGIAAMEGAAQESWIASLVPEWMSRAAERFLGMSQDKGREEFERRVAELAVCHVPEFIAARAFDLAGLDRRTSGILKKMLEQCLSTEAPKDVDLAFRQLETLMRRMSQRHKTWS